VPDIRREPLFLDKTGSRHLERGRVSFIGVPITSHGRCLGVLNVDRLFGDEVAFEEDLSFLTVVATLIGQFLSYLPSTQRNAFNTPIYTISFGLLLVVYSIFSMIKDILDKNKDSFQIFKIIALWLVPVVLSFLILIRGIKIAVRKHKKVLKKGKNSRQVWFAISLPVTFYMKLKILFK